MGSESVVLDPSAERSGVRVLRALRRHSALIAAMALLAGVIGFVGSALLPASYTALSTVYLSASGPFDATGNGSSGEPTRFTADQAGLMTTSEVLTAAGSRMSPPLPAGEVGQAVQAESSTTGNVVVVSAVAPTADRARLLADAVVAAYRDQAQQRVSNAAFMAADSMEDDNLRGQIAMRAAAYGDGVAAVEPAALPDSPSSPQPGRNALIAGLLGLVAGVIMAVGREQRRATLATVGDLELLLGAPFVGRTVRPEGPGFVADPEPDHGPEQDVLVAIDAMLEHGQPHCVLFLSWQRGLTQTALVASTGVAAARHGLRTCVVDGGGKPRGLTHVSVLGPRGRGLEGVTDPHRELDTDMHAWEVHRVGLGLVPLPDEGPGSRGLPVRAQSLAAATERLRSQYNLILVDGPLLTERSLGFALGRGVDGVMLMIDERTSIDDAHEMARRVGLSGVRLIGFVVVGSRPVQAGRPETWLPARRDDEGPISLGAATAAMRRA